MSDTTVPGPWVTHPPVDRFRIDTPSGNAALSPESAQLEEPVVQESTEQASAPQEQAATSVKVDLSDSEEQVAGEGESDVEGFWSPISPRESAPAPTETMTAPPSVPPVSAVPPPPMQPPSVPQAPASVVNLAESSSSLPEPVSVPRKKERLSFQAVSSEDPFPALSSRNPPARSSQARLHSAEPRTASEEQRQIDRALEESLAAEEQLQKRRPRGCRLRRRRRPGPTWMRTRIW